MQSTATAKSLGMYHPNNVFSKPHSNHQGNCDLYHDDSLSIHSFAVTMDCSYQCKKDSQIRSATLSRNFDPDQHGLKKGNGYSKNGRPLMTAFTSVFFNWSTQECIEEGIRQCGSIEEVSSADFKTLKSGNWSISEKPSCKQNDRVLYSPYDQRYKLEKSTSKGQSFAPSLIQIPDGTLMDESNKKTTECKTKIKGTVCYGDCILFDDSKPDSSPPSTMMTRETPESSFTNLVVCGDSLVDAFKGKALSESVAESICQNFYMSTLVKAKIDGTTCSAFRGQANCKSFVKRLLK
jgi:hypothetical protein